MREGCSSFIIRGDKHEGTIFNGGTFLIRRGKTRLYDTERHVPSHWTSNDTPKNISPIRTVQPRRYQIYLSRRRLKWPLLNCFQHSRRLWLTVNYFRHGCSSCDNVQLQLVLLALSHWYHPSYYTLYSCDIYCRPRLGLLHFHSDFPSRRSRLHNGIRRARKSRSHYNE